MQHIRGGTLSVGTWPWGPERPRNSFPPEQDSRASSASSSEQRPPGHSQRLPFLSLCRRAFAFNPPDKKLIKQPVSNVALRVENFKCELFKTGQPA